MPTAAVPVDSSSGLWDRLTNWTSENKAVAYTIAGVAVVVTGAGVVYYLNDSVRPTILHLLLSPPSVIADLAAASNHALLPRAPTNPFRPLAEVQLSS